MNRLRGQRRQRKAAGKGAVPVDSFSDLAFLLIIFFMVATTLLQSQGFEAVLPSATESAAAQPERKVPTISLEGDRILYDTDTVSLAELRTRLDELDLAQQEDRLRIVRLQSAPSIPLSTYYAVWAAIVERGGVVTIVKESR